MDFVWREDIRLLAPERVKILETAHTLGVLPEATIVVAVLETRGIFITTRRDTRYMVEEDLLRVVLSELRKPSLPAEVDLETLPPWVTRLKHYWDIHTTHQDYPHPYERKWIAKLVRGYFAGNSHSDFVAVVRAYRAFKQAEVQVWNREGDFMKRWCERWLLHYHSLREAEEIVAQLEPLLDSLLEEPVESEREFDAEALTKSLLAGLPDNVSRRREKYKFPFADFFRGPLGRFSLSNASACPPWERLIVVGGVSEINYGDSGEKFALADLAAPVKLAWLEDTHPEVMSALKPPERSLTASAPPREKKKKRVSGEERSSDSKALQDALVKWALK